MRGIIMRQSEGLCTGETDMKRLILFLVLTAVALVLFTGCPPEFGKHNP